MADGLLKSYEFRREREATWRELEGLVGQAEKGGVQSLTPRQLLRLPNLYRATLSSLSVARSISLDRALVHYLEALSARAYFCVYGARARLRSELAAFFLFRFPAAVRAAALPILLAAAVMIVGAITGHALTMDSPDWYYTFTPEGMVQGRTPMTPTEELRRGLYENPIEPDTLKVFAAWLFTHNAKIGLLCFSLGFALGIPVVALLWTTGLMIGAFSALYTARGLGADIWGWLLIHGTTELLAVILCGGAGILLGGAIVFPGRRPRLKALADHGRRAAVIAVGAVLMFLVAGLLEGLGRQLITDMTTRYAIGFGMLAFWLAYFIFSGRRDAHGRDR